MEVWKNIKDLEYYQISNFGNVKRLKHKKIIGKSSIPTYRTYNECLLSLVRNKGGYIHANIQGKTYYIHQLVAQAFIPNPENKPEINHIDKNKANNHVKNLEWSTRSENMIHAHNTNI